MCQVSTHDVSYQNLHQVVISTRGGAEKSGSNSLFTQCRGLTL
ncbi:unnamed protein product [Staurois parvus]|uniref:Uncharacterized protein n=1 Tax=Staurois parvus TaxID=386267 RepID=A0ABN9ACR9_9NEOB|nr:unnamed protein product [Staurois parvus]